MIQKINQQVETILHGLAGSPEVECVQRIPYLAAMPSSPLFCLKLDLFFRGPIPQFPDRLKALPSIQFVETSLSREKDRFFMNQMPIHLDYKTVSQVEEELADLDLPDPPLRQDTTYSLFRLYHGIPVHTKSAWIRGVKAKLEALSDDFWGFQKTNLASRLEHLLSDMAAANFNRDGMFFQIAQARFLETLAELLFAFNRQFLGPPEELKFQIEGLDVLPSGFTGYFETMLRDDSTIDRDRRVSLARRLAEGVLGIL